MLNEMPWLVMSNQPWRMRWMRHWSREDPDGDLLAGTGVEAPKDLFASTYPCAFDRRRVEAIEADLEERLKNVQHEGLHERARGGSRLQDACTRALSGLVDLELWTAVARWSAHHRCVPPTLETTGSGIAMVEGRHLLLGVDPDPVTYGVGSIAKVEDQQSIALLSGANSGGKTTLLETLAMVALLGPRGITCPSPLRSCGPDGGDPSARQGPSGPNRQGRWNGP